ncbi:MAG: hypothetical protein U0U66_07795 [Cytophagaceae bacterium]
MKKIYTLVFLLFLAFCSNIVNAQPCPPGPDGEPDCGNVDPGVPLDDAVPLVLLAGAGIGLFVMRKKK